MVFLLLGAIVSLAVASVAVRVPSHGPVTGGVPARCLRWPHRYDQNGPAEVMWPGLVFNTVFYAGILWGGWLLATMPFMLARKRRIARIRRGLCPKCAYDLRGTRGGSGVACPECGSIVAS